ncbi:MAG: DUF4097 family beta strand repeat-containing protein [Candidatus Eisenbacteria bacterium]
MTALDLDNARGLVKVRPSTDGKLHVTAIKICRLQRAEDARRYLRETTVESRAEQGRWVVRVTYPRRIDSRIDFWQIFREHSGGLEFPVLEVQLLVEAPAGWNTRAESVSGDLDVALMRGKIELRSSSGDIALADATGAADLQTRSGDVDAAGVGTVRLRSASGDITVAGAGALDAESTSGDIEVEGARDSLRLASRSGDVRVDAAPLGVSCTTTSGSIRVGAAAGLVRLHTLSGDLGVTLAPGVRRCDAATGSGSLDADLDPGLSATIRMQTTSGDIECAAAVRTQSQDRRHLTAVFGRGGAPVTLQTVSGDLNLTSGGH